MAKSYSSLFPQVVSEINKRTGKEIIITGSRFTVQPSGEGGSLDARALAEVITTIASDLADLIEPRIISGLDATATVPPSASIEVTAGTATSDGRKWEINSNVTLQIPFDDSTYVFYVTIYDNALQVNRTHDDTKCEICRIIIPNPGTTSAIVDDKPDDGYDAWIVSAKDIVYDEDQQFDDASIEKLRDVIGDILAENLIGNIRLSENLKITNTQNSLELDSASVKIKDFNERVLAKFDSNGVFFYDGFSRTLAKFGPTEAFIGNILVTQNAIQTRNFISGVSGFRIEDSGNVEFNNGVFRGILSANTGNIGGFTITNSKIYATTTGVIQTAENVGTGADGVVLDKDGLRVYDAILGLVVALPSNGSAPTFSSGIINNTVFEINTNAVLRTAATVGDGSPLSAGILINNTGIYGCEANQLLLDANLKALIDGTVRLKGEILANAGQIGNVTITQTELSGGTIRGANIISSLFETSDTLPKTRIDTTGIYYQTTTSVGKYGASGAGLSGFRYAQGKYGAGVTAYMFNDQLPILAVMSERINADVRLFNRISDPISGSHAFGDVICTQGLIKRCTTPGSPGVFSTVGVSDFLGLSDTPDSYSGQADKVVKVNAGSSAVEFGDVYPFKTGDWIVSSVTTARTGWTDVSGTYSNKFMRINATPLTTGGADTHSHTLSEVNLPSHTHAAGSLAADSAGAHTHQVPLGTVGGASLNVSRYTSSNTSWEGVNTDSAGAHAHTVSGSTGAIGSGTAFTADNVPAYIQIVVFKKD